MIFFLLMLFMGGVVSVIISFSEFILFPLFIKRPRIGSMILWTIWSIIWLSSGMFFLYNYLGDWHDFIWPSYFEFIRNIGTIALIPIVGVIIYLQSIAIQGVLFAIGETSGTTDQIGVIMSIIHCFLIPLMFRPKAN